MYRHRIPLQLLIHPIAGGPSETTQGLSKNALLKLCHLHMHRGSPGLPIFRVLWRSPHRHPSAAQGPSHTVYPTSPLSTLYPPPLTSAINTHLAIQYSSILSTCSIHLNTLWSTLLASFLSIPVHLRTSSFLSLSFLDTATKLKHFISRTFLFILSVLIHHASGPYNAVSTTNYSFI